MYGLRSYIGFKKTGMFELWKRKRKQVVRCCNMVSCVICEKPIIVQETYTFIVGKFFHRDCLKTLSMEYEKGKDKGYEAS